MWIATWSESLPRDSTAWLVLTGADGVAATVILPADLRITQIGLDYVLGIFQDTLGVQRIREYRVTAR
jgi:hypothetical protein